MPPEDTPMVIEEEEADDSTGEAPPNDSRATDGDTERTSKDDGG